MASRTPSFFLAPSWDYLPPPVGPIQLGNIITSVETPQEPLCNLAMPSATTEQRNFSFSTKQLKERRLGILFKFLSMVTGVGADASVSLENSHNALFTFDSLQTVQFVPTLDYLEKCIGMEPVKRYLMKSRYRKPVYVITGLKIASMPRRGVPVGVGPEFGIKTETKQKVEWEGTNDFVFAYRLRKVAVKKTDKVKENSDYVKGAMMEDMAERPQERQAIIVPEEEDGVDTDLSEDRWFMDFEEELIWIIPSVDKGQKGFSV
ncbi:hypothetical protein K456DRAFT_1765070 [Colletotrichum gloeosporioides 23]|nr:hypothetical protein K456DRAFT_1765070 [Colletotrichum gloeosporioides 23]